MTRFIAQLRSSPIMTVHSLLTCTLIPWRKSLVDLAGCVWGLPHRLKVWTTVQIPRLAQRSIVHHLYQLGDQTSIDGGVRFPELLLRCELHQRDYIW